MPGRSKIEFLMKLGIFYFVTAQQHLYDVT